MTPHHPPGRRPKRMRKLPNPSAYSGLVRCWGCGEFRLDTDRERCSTCKRADKQREIAGRAG